MASLRAKLTKRLLKTFSSKKDYNVALIDKHRQQFEKNISRIFPKNRKATTKYTELAGVKVAWIQYKSLAERTIVYLHGGGFTVGSIKSHQQHIARLAKFCKAKVLAIDYSLAPENPFPIALDEIQAVWQELIKQGLDVTNTAIVGDSAGGNLALASSLRFKAARLPQPVCLVMLSPALDGTFSGNSYATNKDKELFLTMKKFNFIMENYVQKHSKKDPFVSPVFADLSGIPPFLTHVGSEEMVLSDSETIIKNAKRDGVDGRLYVGKDMWHGWHLFAGFVPEAKRDMKAVADYIISYTPVGSAPPA